MDYNTLRYIVEVVETGSISKAASNLFMSQSTLSLHISAFEKEIGHVIFSRNNRGVQLTSNGMELYHHATQVVKQCELISKNLFNNPNEQKIKICSFGSDIINVEFLNLCKKYDDKNYEFELYECGTQQAVDSVVSRKYDLGVILFSSFQEKRLMQYIAPENLEVEKLFMGDMRIRIGKQSLLAHKEVITKEDLSDLFFVKKTYQTETLFSLDEEIAQMGIENTNKTILARSSKTCYDALQSLPSFSVGASWSCKWGIGKDIVRRPFDGPKIDMHCAIVKRKNELLKTELKDFVDQLVFAYN